MKLIRTITTILTLLLCFSVGCRPERKEKPRQQFTEIDQVVKEEIAKDNFPGAVVLVGQKDDIVYWKAFAHAGRRVVRFGIHDQADCNGQLDYDSKRT